MAHATRSSDLPGPPILSLLRSALAESPVPGRTYSLYGAASTTEEYYDRVGALAAWCEQRWPDMRDLLARIQRAGRRRRSLRTAVAGSPDPVLGEVLPRAREALAPYTAAVPAHLSGLRTRDRLDRVLTTVRDEYHLLMLEIELVNRLHAASFGAATTRLAFLPHCLRDWSRDCRSSVEGHDYVCRGCSKGCWVNGVSRLLRMSGVSPYIWMTADLRRLLRRQQRDGAGVGVLGIACVPELARGMRLCMRAGVPVVGVPLNANRCARWTGRFQPTSVNLSRIAALLGSSPLLPETPARPAPAGIFLRRPSNRQTGRTRTR